jgi:SAM-dependent methyltransferase
MAPSHYGPEQHQVTQCNDCGMVYTNPQTTTYLEEVENRGALERHFDPQAIRAKRDQAHFLLKLIARYSPGRSLLDFGCGIGAVVEVARESGWNATGFDLNGGLVERANEFWGGRDLVTGNLGNFYASHQGKFDAILSFQVFEHLQQPVDTGTELVRLLRPGGVILIDVPYVYQPAEWISRGKTLDPTSHWCHFSKRTLADLVRRLDCEVVYCSAAPSLVGFYNKLGFGRAASSLGLLTKACLPPIGSGVCVIGRKARDRRSLEAGGRGSEGKSSGKSLQAIANFP